MWSRPATSSERRGQVSWEEGYIRSRPALLEQLHSDLLSRIGSEGKKDWFTLHVEWQIMIEERPALEEQEEKGEGSCVISTNPC